MVEHISDPCKCPFGGVRSPWLIVQRLRPFKLSSSSFDSLLTPVLHKHEVGSRIDLFGTNFVAEFPGITLFPQVKSSLFFEESCLWSQLHSDSVPE